MEGTTDNPIVSPNTFKLKESLNNKFKTEKRKLKDVIKNEIDNNGNSQQIDNPDYNKIVEWENVYTTEKELENLLIVFASIICVAS